MPYLLDEKMFYFRALDNFDEMSFKIYRIVNRILEQPQHFHDYIQLWYVKQGECKHYVNEVAYTLTKGSIFILPPDIPHRVHITDNKNVELIGCEFSKDFINEEIMSEKGATLFDFAYLEPFLVNTDNVKPFFNLDGASAKIVEDTLENTVFEYTNKNKYYELFIKANLLKILAIMAREYDKGIDPERQGLVEKYKNVMNDAINYITENYRKKIYLEDVRKIAMMSPTYFSFVFKQITGRTFTEYINFLRILKAKELLINSSKTVNSISYELGFNDAAYFDRVFKKEVGVSPGQFRKMST